MKVFISSTYKDLIDYRAAAIRAVEGTNYQASKMEVFGARAEEPVVACLKEVAASDLFIGIYAHRYGHVPTGSDISITEMEYVHAKERGKKIYCFVIDEENQPWLPKFMEGEPGATKLKDFKQRFQTDYTCAFFTSSEDLGMKVANALSHYVANSHSDFPISAFEPRKPTGSTLPTQPFFFGRATELATIAEALAPESRTWGALIDGPGGIGKTALAIRAAHLAPADLFERKIFISAKVRELRPDGEKPLTDFTRPDYLAMLTELARELGEVSIPHLPPDQRANALRLALAGVRALIVFDNLETLPEDERTRLFQFLERLPAGNKAIVTSRRRADTGGITIRLERLARDAALQLLDELAANNPQLKSATPEQCDQFYAITQGNPLLMRWIAGQVGREGSRCRTIADACAFLAAAPAGNDPLEYIFGDLLETVSADETKVLAALTHFSLPAKAGWVAQMTGLPERAAETALEDLSDRSILTADVEARAFFLPPLAAQFIKTRRPETVAKTGDALCDRAFALAMQYGGGDNYAGFKTLDDEWNLLAAALPRLLQGENKRLQDVCEQLVRFFDFTGRWDESLWLCAAAEQSALAAGDKESAGWRAYQAGHTYALRNQAAEVLACAERAAAHWTDFAPRQKAIVIALCGLGYELQQNYLAAIAAYREVLEISRPLSAESTDVAVTLNNLADAEYKYKDYASAERDYREALRIAKKNNHQEGVAACTGNLAKLALYREQWVEAEVLAREALALAEQVGRDELIAGCSYYIAQALHHRTSTALSEAAGLARRAVEIYTRLRSKDLFEAQKLLAQIESAIESAQRN